MGGYNCVNKKVFPIAKGNVTSFYPNSLCISIVYSLVQKILKNRFSLFLLAWFAGFGVGFGVLIISIGVSFGLYKFNKRRRKINKKKCSVYCCNNS